MRRYIALAAIVMLAAPLAAQGTFILVSNSDCDTAMAEVLASVMEAKIIKVEWGKYDESAIKKAVESGSKNFIIIGGNKAVLDQIEKTLKDMGFSILRVAGKDRAETSLEVYRTFKKYFNDDFAVIVVDMNKYSIQRGKKLALQNRVPLFFCDISELDDMIKEINALGIEEVKIITGNRQDDLRTICEKRLKEDQKRLEGVAVTEENQETVDECNELLEKATEAFEDGNYLLCLEYLTELENLLSTLEG